MTSQWTILGIPDTAHTGVTGLESPRSLPLFKNIYNNNNNTFLALALNSGLCQIQAHMQQLFFFSQCIKDPDSWTRGFYRSGLC